MNTQTMERAAVTDLPRTAPGGNVVPYTAPTVPKAYSPKIAKALLAVTREIGAVEKSGWNDFHKYAYQKWEDVLGRLSEILPKHGLIIMQSEVARSLFENDQMMAITYDFTIVNEDGDVWPERPVWTAIARARDSKGTPDDKAANKAHTQAHKYFLLHTFKIRTKDSVEDDSDGDQPAKAAAPKPPKPGSEEAAALDGPRAVTAGHDAASWADAFIAAINGATPENLAKWIEANKLRLDKLKAYPEVDAKVQAAIKPVAPKPPRPGATSPAAPAQPAVPNPETDAPGWVAWLIEKMKGFDSYEAGETFFNDKIQAMDLPDAVQEDALAVFRRFERRFEA